MHVEQGKVLASVSLVDRAEAVERRAAVVPGQKLRVRRLWGLLVGVLLFGASLAVYVWLLLG